MIVVDLGGYLPFFCKKIVAKLSAQSGTRMADKIMKGVEPKSLFAAEDKM